MKKYAIIFIFALLFALYSCLVQHKGNQALYNLQHSSSLPNEDSLNILDPIFPEGGNAEAGYQYLLYGNGFSSGLPYGLYKKFRWAKKTDLSLLTGENRFVVNDFIVFKNNNGKLTATPGCLNCHSQLFNGKRVVGLGNSYSNFQTDKTKSLKLAENAIKLLYGKNSDEWKNAEQIFKSGYVLAPMITTEMQGPVSALKISEVMASHRDPQTLKFRADTTYFFVPSEVFPEDVAPLWGFKKKKASFINALGQGDLAKLLMCGTTITLKDTAEAREIYSNMKNVWAFIKTLEPPQYPNPINKELADKGKILFLQNCSSCHGTYDENEFYPNQLIAASIIGTDSLMWKYYLKYPGYPEWFNKSWFAASSSPAYKKPQKGYVAPPLDGVWCTAPYFHNGSVPDLDAVLNSNKRPRYWKRSFSKEKYNYKNPGWKYKVLPKPGNKKTYNTDIPGYGNYGHYFGDHLSDQERKAVIEYLKTL
ncbi:MAG TPA: hypothetical protein VI461_10395 [Chitinophagaceae bacterium]|nr:hypothetical protein [Chitinophagaceae bacterium]